MKTKVITKKEALKAARDYFNVKRYRGDCHLMGGNRPYWLFIYKGDSFEIR